MRLVIFILAFVSIFFVSSTSKGNEITITGSVQFWQRHCSHTYDCNLPSAVSPRIEIASLIKAPTPGSTLSSVAVNFEFDTFSGKLSVYWNLNAGDPYLAGQSYLSKDGQRIAECSHFAKADVESFIPTGFCSGYLTLDDEVTQFGMTFYK